ncbi:FHA domain-containing protein, partial [bacterium]|nr:FHA domain-containing protein [bacterium]
MILKITQLDGSSNILKLKPEESSQLYLGREEGDFILNDPLVSRNHLLIQWSESKKQYFCKDLDTTNGTFLNGKSISNSELFPGDLIIAGDTWISVEEEIIEDDILNEIYQVLTSIPSEDQNTLDNDDETGISSIKYDVESGNTKLALRKLEKLENSFNEEKKVLRSLLEIGRMISSFLNMDKLVTFLINIIANIFDVSEGAIYINTASCQKIFYLGRKKTDPNWEQLYASEFKTEDDNAHAVPIKSKTTTFGILYIKTIGSISKNYNDILLILANNCAISLENIILYQKMEDIYLGTIRVLSAALESKDIYTIGHSERVMAYSVLISAELGLTSEKLDDIKYAALLHDIGKIGIHENILNKPRKLTPEEFEIIKSHPTIGAKIIA